MGSRTGKPLGARRFRGCAIDWAGVIDPTLRVLPDDPCGAGHGVVGLPSEAALITWTAHRCHRALQPLFAQLHRVSDGALSVGAMWRIVGSAVVTAATQIPLLAGSSELSSMRRGQAVLDALVGFGLQCAEYIRLRRRRF